jgi:type I restriction enzyme S subunit
MTLDVFHTPISELIDTGVLVVNDGYRAKNSELSSKGLPFARAQNIKSGFQFDGADCLPLEDLGKLGIKVSEPGDVVFTSKGTVGRFAFVTDETPRFVYSPQLCFWRVLDLERLHPRWLYYWMHSREFFVQFSGVAGQTDMADYVSLRDQRRMHIRVPSLGEQKAIAGVLGALDDKIELNRRMNETLEAMARAIFKSWFVDFDPVRAKADGRQPYGMDAETAALFPDSFQDSPLGKIPKGWKAGCLADVASNLRRPTKPESVSADTPYVGLEHLPRRCFSLTDWGLTSAVTSGKSAFHNGEVLLGKLRPYFHKVAPAPVDGLCSTDILVLAAKKPQWSVFVLLTVASDEFIAHADATSTGTRMPRTNWRDMARYSLALPDDRLIVALQSLVRPMLAGIQARIHESRTLSAIRDALLPKLMSGELPVSDAGTILGRYA